MATVYTTLEEVESCGRAFAMLHRPSHGPTVEVISGQHHRLTTVDDLEPLLQASAGEPGTPELVVALPYRLVTEHGFEAPEDDTPLLALSVDARHDLPLDDFLARPATPLSSSGFDFDISDAAYSELVGQVIKQEVNGGEGANFVLSRSLKGCINDFDAHKAVELFHAILRHERGTYWTFLFWTPEYCLVGASPECHVRVLGGMMSMNPISGTFRYGDILPKEADLLRFLNDQKESEELYMVVDEELKILAKACDREIEIDGPHLRYMQNLAHTEYTIRGRLATTTLEALRATLMAPTVTGSPRESACRVIARHEVEPRGFYSGVLARFGRDDAGLPELDSSILIRTAQIDRNGETTVRVGASIVRSSDPQAEAQETRAKALALVGALSARGPSDRPTDGSSVEVVGRLVDAEGLLARRNERLAPFWFGAASSDPAPQPRQIAIIDAEDRFTDMLAYQLRSFGDRVTVVDYSDLDHLPVGDLLIMGPGPGDPTNLADAKIATLSHLTREALDRRRPLLAICLGHQVVAHTLGLQVVRKTTPNQGTQRTIDLDGRRVQVGYYNSFAVRIDSNVIDTVWGPATVTSDRLTQEVDAITGERFRSFQFHPESVLSPDGLQVLRQAVDALAAADNLALSA